jgi:hypothetical protein
MVLSPERHGLAVASGKGKTSTKTPSDIQRLGDALYLSTDKVAESCKSEQNEPQNGQCPGAARLSALPHAFFFAEKDGAVMQPNNATNL